MVQKVDISIHTTTIFLLWFCLFFGEKERKKGRRVERCPDMPADRQRRIGHREERTKFR